CAKSGYPYYAMDYW
nr:immunoglobulin heavy chain junction region [Mus musculus]